MSLILRSGLVDSKCKSQFSRLENVLGREMMESYSELSDVIRLNFQ